MSEANGLPKGWVAVALGDVAEFEMGQAPPGKECNFEGRGTLFVKAGEFGKNRPIEREWTTGPLKFGRKEDVFICVVGATCGKLNLGADCAIGRSVAAIRPSGSILQHFLYFQLQPFVLRLRASSAGSAQGVLTRQQLSHVSLRLPALNEQRRIVAKIEELFSDLDAGVAALERAKANLKRYRAAVLKAAVTGQLTAAWRAKNLHRPLGEGRGEGVEPATKLLSRILADRRRNWEQDQLAKFTAANKTPPKNWQAKYADPGPPDTTNLPDLPDRWCWATLDQLLIYLRNGYFQSPSKAESGTPILRINAVRPMRVDLTESRFLDDIKGDIDDYFIENGDLLFTRYNGSVDLLGVAGMVRNCSAQILHPDKLIRVKLGSGYPLPAFVEIAANVGASRKHMVGRARTTAGQTGISGPDVREMPIPLPPPEEQTQIVAEVAEKLSQIEAAEVAIDHGLARAARLRQSILKRAFSGQLVPQDPHDEPASVLLERISTDGQDTKSTKQRNTQQRLKAAIIPATAAE